MNWNTNELNEIKDLSDLKGKIAIDKYNDRVKIIEAFRTPGKLSTATISKIDKRGQLMIVDIPLCCLRIVKE